MIALMVVPAALIAVALAFIRLLRGPSQADRVVAIEVVFASSVAMTAAAASSTGYALLLDVGIGLALAGFVATIAWARLIERQPPGGGT